MIAAGYPERDVPRDGALDRLLGAAEYYVGKLAVLRRPLGRIVAAVHACERDLEGEDLAGLAARAVSLRPRLRREGFTEPLCAEAFALVRAAAGTTVGMRHFDVQLVGGWAMLNGDRKSVV